MFFLCSENKGADQLRGYREADLRLCFSHMQKASFLMKRLIVIQENRSLLTIWGPALNLCYIQNCYSEPCYKEVEVYIVLRDALKP